MFDSASKICGNNLKKTSLMSRNGKRNILQPLQPSSLNNNILVGSGRTVTLDLKNKEEQKLDEYYSKCSVNNEICKTSGTTTDADSPNGNDSKRNEKLLQRNLHPLCNSSQSLKFCKEDKSCGEVLKNGVEANDNVLQNEVETKRKADLVSSMQSCNIKRNKLCPSVSCQMQSEAHLVTGDISTEYWKELAEQRRIALEEALKENEMLSDQLEVLETENAQLRELAGEAKYLANILENLITE